MRTCRTPVGSRMVELPASPWHLNSFAPTPRLDEHGAAILNESDGPTAT